MPDMPVSDPTQYLSLEEYENEFYKAVESLREPVWKSERAQTFSEPGNKSWEAFVAGDWDEAMRIAESEIPSVVAFYKDLQSHDSGLNRIRVVELPISQYLKWELRILMMRTQAGESVRVLNSAKTADFESREGRIPELVVLGEVAYLVDYAPSGEPRGAFRITDPAEVDRAATLVKSAFALGEELSTFFEREVLTTS